MKAKGHIKFIAGLLLGAVMFSNMTAFAAEKLTIPDNYAAILDLAAIKWSDADSTGHKAGAVVTKAIDDVGTLVCYYVPDDYAPDTVITREADKGTFYFVIGYAPGAPAEYKRGKAAILCSPDKVATDQSHAIFVEDLQGKFGTAKTQLPAAATPTATPAPTVTTPTPAANAEPTETYTNAEFAAEVIRLINVEREKAGVKPLLLDDKLCEIATLKAKEMVELKYFGHNSPNYGNPRMFAKHYGYKEYSGVGENLHWGHIDQPSEVVDAWMKSVKGHKEAMLNPMYTKVGLGFDGNKYALELAKK